MAESDRYCIVADVGKTHCKITVFDQSSLIAQHSIPTPALSSAPYQSFDTQRIWAFFCDAIASLARDYPIGAIVPVAHGAAFAGLTGDGRLACPVLDYEAAIPDAVATAYDALRDPFSVTGSPRLPGGLNLGQQMFYLQREGHLDASLYWLTYPQYWAYRFSGILASEISSLGCHTDLWDISGARYSPMVLAQGWDRFFPPIRPAAEALGQVAPALAGCLGLPDTCQVYCGAHDSNAALHAIRTLYHGGDPKPMIIATGTWNVAMAPGRGGVGLDPVRDNLINLSVGAEPVACARFMGGREFACIARPGDPGMTKDSLAEVLQTPWLALPNFTQSGGPFPGCHGRISPDVPCPDHLRSALGTVYLALVWDQMLELIDQGLGIDTILIEGPAAGYGIAELMAALRPTCSLYLASAGVSPSLGGAMLAGYASDEGARFAKAACNHEWVEPLAHYKENWLNRLGARHAAASVG